MEKSAVMMTARDKEAEDGAIASMRRALLQAVCSKLAKAKAMF